MNVYKRDASGPSERTESLRSGELNLSHPVRRDSLRDDISQEMQRAFTALVLYGAKQLSAD